MSETYTMVSFMVPDQKVGFVLRVAAQIKALNVDTSPVVNVKEGQNGKAVAVANGTLVERIMAHLDPKNPPTSAQLRVMISEVGGNPSSVSYVAKQLIDAKILKTTGKKQTGKVRQYTYGAGYVSK